MPRLKSHQRLSSKGKPFESYLVGQRVQVFTGMGWKKGTVSSKTKDRIAVNLDMDDGKFPRHTYDPRNCLPLN